MWNFNGFRSSKALSIKQTGCAFFDTVLKDNDLICFSETWREPSDKSPLDISENFAEFHEPGYKNHLGGRPSGGMSLLVRKSIFKHVSVVLSDSYHFWCKLNKVGFGWKYDLFICFIYIPPSSSTLLRTGQALSFETLQSECAHYEQTGWVLLCGDFNARTNDVNDFIENDEFDEYLPLDDNYLPDQYLDKRLSKDTYPINANGTAFIEFCKSSGYRIMNGRVDKDNSCNFTCFANNGNSIVDYALLRKENFCMVEKLRVGELCELSDHSPIEISLKTSYVSNRNESLFEVSEVSSTISNENTLLREYDKQFYVNDDSILENLSLAMEGREIMNFLENISELLDKDDLNIEIIVELLRSKLVDISESHFSSKKLFHKNWNSNSKTNCPWFDTECKEHKRLLNSKRKAYQAALKRFPILRDEEANDLRSAYFQQRRVYKKLIRFKRHSFLEKKKSDLWKLKGEAPKVFWKKLKNRKSKPSLKFTNNQLSTYFSTLLNFDNQANNSEIEISASSHDTLTQNIINETLNRDISLEEVKLMAKKLKTGKASGLDMITAELLKHANDNFMLVFTKLFNKLLLSGKFPEEWSVGIIVVLFKGGDETDLNNYRGITLLSIFGKFFLGVLLERLNNIIAQFEILEQNQIGFRKDYQTSDHIFTLRALTENYFNNNKGPLYVCFVDFKKAFDSVDHKLLLQQLVTYGIKGNFLRVISSLYDKVKSCVRGNHSLTNIFPCNRGVRQGCLLSPVLFALYLNDLNRHIKASSQGVLVDDIPVHSLLYADDLVLIAKDRIDLQSQLDALHKFSNSLKMEVNMDKTKVMLIQKQKSRAKSKKNKTWKIGDKEIKECVSYKYLGVTIKSNGSFSIHIDIIKEKAHKAYFSLISKSKEWGGFQPRLFLYLFDHTIAPILNYASEIWGLDKWSILETLHLKACKYALGVRSSTTTDAVYAELGRVSLQCQRHINILNFFARLSSLDSKRYASKALSMLTKDADYGRSNWVSHARDLRVQYEIQQADTRSVIKTKVIRHFKSEVLHRLNEHITEDRKLHLFASFKTIYKFESYLDYIQDFSVRCTLARLRVSAHNLQVETGRFNKTKTPRDQRFCLYCKTLNIFIVEDEIHFLLVCSLFNEERQKFLEEIHKKFPATVLLNDRNMFLWLMSQEDYIITKRIGMFCKTSFTKRSKFLSNPKSTY